MLQPNFSAKGAPAAASEELFSSAIGDTWSFTMLNNDTLIVEVHSNNQEVVWGRVIKFVAKTIAAWMLEGTLDHFFKDDFDRFLTRTREWLKKEFDIADRNDAIGSDQVKIELLLLSNLMTNLESRVKDTEQSQEELMGFVQNLYANEILPMQKRMEEIEVRLAIVEEELDQLDHEIETLGLQVQENTERIENVEKEIYTNVR